MGGLSAIQRRRHTKGDLFEWVVPSRHRNLFTRKMHLKKYWTVYDSTVPAVSYSRTTYRNLALGSRPVTMLQVLFGPLLRYFLAISLQWYVRGTYVMQLVVLASDADQPHPLLFALCSQNDACCACRCPIRGTLCSEIVTLLVACCACRCLIHDNLCMIICRLRGRDAVMAEKIM